MTPRALDHVALWLAARDNMAAFLTRHLDVHVIERTDRFTLLGSDARHGKLTLFAAEAPRERGALEHVALRVPSLERAAAQLPGGLPYDSPRPGELAFDLAEGLRLALVEQPTPVAYDLDHVALRTHDPHAAVERYVELGFERAEPGRSGHQRVAVGTAFVELHPGGNGSEPERPLLNHLAVLVDSAAEHAAWAEERGAEIADVVDAPNTHAVFVWGPERVKLEYVAHKPTFSLR